MDADTATRLRSMIQETNVSSQARILWLHLALLSSKEKPEVHIRQKDFAKIVQCSTKALRKCIRELLEVKLLSQKNPAPIKETLKDIFVIMPKEAWQPIDKRANQIDRVGTPWLLFSPEHPKASEELKKMLTGYYAWKTRHVWEN